MLKQSLESKSPLSILKTIGYGILTLIIVIMLFMSAGVNDAGHRTVVQWPTGYTYVKFEPGLYWQFLGTTWTYNDVLTLDFDDEENAEGATIDQEGIRVRYQDGGLGAVYGVARFTLPNVEEDMLKLHKAFRSNSGVGYKLLKNVTEAAVNQTAGLMTSEESYAEKRGTFTEMARTQLEKGKYVTAQKPVVEVEYGYEFCLEADLSDELKKQCKNVKKTTKMVPVVRLGGDGQPMHLHSDLETYGIGISGFEIVDWGYEDKTLKQISQKREAQMAIITAKANAERAKQDAITAEQQGLANVMQAKYEKEVEKERAVVDAERQKQVAVIEAMKRVDVAEQEKLEQEQLKLAAAEYKQKETLRGQGDAAYKRAVIEADGALQQKLETYERVMNRFAAAVEKQKWVPEVIMGGSAESTGSSANTLIELLTTKTAKDLALDMSIRQ